MDKAINQQQEKNQNSEAKGQQSMKRAADYLRMIAELPAEDQAFLDGFLFAKVTEAEKKGA